MAAASAYESSCSARSIPSRQPIERPRAFGAACTRGVPTCRDERSSSASTISKPPLHGGAGFLVRHDYYTGINLGCFFDCRASMTSGAVKIADHIFADRVRRRVIKAADRRSNLSPRGPSALMANQSASTREELYWAHAPRAEALIALGDPEGKAALKAADALGAAAWMIKTTHKQIEKLTAFPAQGIPACLSGQSRFSRRRSRKSPMNDGRSPASSRR